MSMTEEQPGAAVEEAPPSGPLSERLASKNWKWRASAYDELRDSPTPVLLEHAERVASMLADKNAAAAEKAIAVAQALVERAPLAVLSAHAAAIGKELVNSGLGARPSAKAAAQSLLELLVEAEQVDATIDQLLAGCAHKTPKVRLAAIETLLSVVKQFGVAPLPVKTLLKALPPFFNDSDAKVRANASELAVELHRCLGPIVATQLADLRPAQLTELQPKWAALPPPGSVVPTRFLRSASAAAAVAAAASQHADGDSASSSTAAASSSSSTTTTARSGVAVPTIDAYDLAEPVAVLSKLPKSLYSGLASANWKERTAELDNLLPLTDAARLAPGDYGELCSALRKVIANDANAMCVQKAAAVLTNLARGLRADFTAQARVTVPVLLGKFKEKKPFVVQALHAALDEIHPRLLQLVDILDDVKVALRDKTPSTRAQALLFVARAVSLADAAQLRKSLKPVASALLNMLNDTLPEVRSAACQAVAALVVAVGDSVAAPILASLDDMKRSNIERAVADAAAKKSAPAAAAVVAPAAAASTSAMPSRPSAATAAAPAAAAISAPSRFEKPAAAAAASRPTPSVAASAASKPAAAAATSAPADIAPLQTSEQAAELAATLAPADVLAALASKAWKERVDAATKLAELCAGDLDLSQPLAGDAIVRTLQTTPGWKESNFQVVQAIFACVTALAQRDKSFSLATASLAMPLLVDKLGDAKLGAPAAATLTALAVALGPSAVFELLQPHVDAHRNSKVKASACQWVAEALNAFGSAALPWASGVVAFAARVMDDPRAKSEAVALLCTVRQHAGSDGAVFARLGDLKPALHAAIEAEFTKVASVGAPQPTLAVQRPQAAASSSAPKARPAPAAAAAAPAPRAAEVAASAERRDISASITAALLEQLGAAKWSDRDEAMSRVSAILSGEGGNCVSGNVRELPIALAARLTDSNKNLRVRACALVGQLGAALGPEGEAAGAHLLPPMLTLLGDNRKAMRDAVCAALDSWYDALGLPAMAPYLAAPLATDSSIVRRTLLAWLDQRTAGQELPQCSSLAQAVPALLGCAEDRTADVRQLASSALQLCLAVGVSFDVISRAVDELRPASRVALQPLLDVLAERANVAVPSRPAAAAVARTPARSAPAAKVSPVVSSARKPSAPLARPTRSAVSRDDNDDNGEEHEQHLDVDGGDDDDDDDDDEVQVNMGSVRPAPLASAALTAIASKHAGAFRIETSDDDDDDNEDGGTDVVELEDHDDDDADGAPPPTVIDEVDESDLAGLSRTWLETVRAGEPSSVIEALKLWCGVMASDECDAMLGSLDSMTAALVALLPMARNMLDNDVAERAAVAAAAAGGASAPGARFYKYLLNAIKTAFATRGQAQLIASHTLEAVLLELLSGLVHPVLRSHADGELLMVAINQLVISVLEFASLSEALLALLRLLTLTSHSSTHPARLSETVARALLKLAKAKLSTAEQVAAVDVDRVMLELHRFLDRHPPHAWRADANFELRAVKTLLHTLVSALGDDVRAHLKLVPLDRAQPPVLVGYVHVMLSDRKRRQSAEPSDAADAGKSPTYRENVAPNAAEGVEAVAGNEAYMTRLRSLQQKFGLRGADADAGADASAQAASSISASETPAAATASSTSIAELRARLARIKATI